MSGADSFPARLISAFRWVGDVGTRRELADRTGWYENSEIIAGLGAALVSLFEDNRPTVIVGPAGSGFILGPLAAVAAKTGFIGLERRRRDLANSDTWVSATTPLDYQGRNMELHARRSLFSPNDRVLLVDDWAETGGQLLAAKTLSEAAGAEVIGSAVVVDALSEHSVRRALNLRSILHVRDLRSS